MNSCNHDNLSLIKRVGSRVIFPSYFYDDYFVELFDNFEVEMEDVTDEDKNKWGLTQPYMSVSSADMDRETLQLARTEAYSAQVWYPELEALTYKSQLIPISVMSGIGDAFASPAEIHTAILDALSTTNVKFPAFVKLDTVSAKDTQHSGVFASAQEVATVFTSSSRIVNTLHRTLLTRVTHALFVREIDSLFLYNSNDNNDTNTNTSGIPRAILLRCFIHHRDLVAISSDEEHTEEEQQCLKQTASAFFQQDSWKDNCPFMDAVVELRIRWPLLSSSSSTACTNCLMTEINSFGADSPAGAGQFSWKEDYIVLHGALLKQDGVVFRCAPTLA